ncbi:MAG TPA: hypothetical protein ENF67_01915, partial [Candidatus Pacearchaeota archaeon]|nr:hypothetical protein [Candidatus Pacearchaeota archaeon]
MKIAIALSLISLIFLSFQLALADELKLSSYYVNTIVNISNELESSSDVIINLTAFPLNDERQSSAIETFPPGEITENYIKLELERGKNVFFITSNTKSFLYIPKIKRTKLSEAIKVNKNKEFTSPTFYITSNDEFIKNKADQLKSDDAFETLFNIASYVDKIMEYDLNSKELKKASELLKERKGVCSHYTILFLALTRALGFPSRYVSGLAYSTEEKRFIEHAWAEVYLNERWIPFDLTFHQYGWLDAFHIALKKSKEARKEFVQYFYYGKLTPKELEINTRIVNISKEKKKLYFEIEVKPLFNEVSLTSYVPIKVTVKNPNDFYFSLPLHLAVAPGLFGKNERVVLLKPKGKGETFFIVKLSPRDYEKCKRGCKAKIVVKDFFDNSASSSIIFSEDNPTISLEEAKAIVKE